MNSTNVPSKKLSNHYSASAQMVPTEKEGLKIPPENALKSLSTFSIIRSESNMEIDVKDCKVDEKKKAVIGKDGQTIMILNLQESEYARKTREERAPSVYGKEKVNSNKNETTR